LYPKHITIIIIDHRLFVQLRGGRGAGRVRGAFGSVLVPYDYIFYDV
jgi:hypothetical protein